MAQVPYDPAPPSPTAIPQTNLPDDYQRINATPSSFGGQTAQGLEKLGSGMLKATDLYDQIAGDQSVNNYMKESTDIINQYKALHGQDAMSAREATEKALEDARVKAAGSTFSANASMRVENDTRRMQYMMLSALDNHYNQQAHAWGLTTNKTIFDDQAQLAALDPTNEEFAGTAFMKAFDASKKLTQLQMGNVEIPAEQLRGLADAAHVHILQARVTALLGNDPVAAKDLMQQKGANGEDWSALLPVGLRDHVVTAARARSMQPVAQDLIMKSSMEPRATSVSAQNLEGIKPVAQEGPISQADATIAGLSPIDRDIGNFIANKEGGKPNIVYGGKAVDIDKGFPTWAGAAGPEGTTHAAGTFQFQPGTWKIAAVNAGTDSSDFSPANQAKVGVAWAKKTYQDATGRDLTADWQSGNVDQSALAGQWASFQKGNKAAQAERMDAESQALLAAKSDPRVKGPEDYAVVERQIRDSFRIVREQQQAQKLAQSDQNDKALRGIGDQLYKDPSFDLEAALANQPNLSLNQAEQLRNLKARGLQEKLIGSAANPGMGFGQVHSLIMNPDQPDGIKNQEQLLEHFQGGGLTQWGYQQASAELAEMNKPHAEADNMLKTKFYQEVNRAITLEDESMPGFKARGSDEMLSDGLPVIMKGMADGLKNGKTMAQLTAKDSKDSIWPLVERFTPPARAAMAAQINGGKVGNEVNGSFPVPSGVDKNSWGIEISDSPFKEKQIWAGVLQKLAADPSPNTKAWFNYKFGQQGYDADRMLKKLKPEKVSLDAFDGVPDSMGD